MVQEFFSFAVDQKLRIFFQDELYKKSFSYDTPKRVNLQKNKLATPTILNIFFFVQINWPT